MIDQLRKRFILLTMASVIFVLAVLMTVINAANFAEKNRSSGAILTMLAENDGVFPEIRPDNAPEVSPKEPASMTLPEPPQDNRFFRQNQNPAMSEETPFETRYFTVVLDANGVLVSVNTGQIAAINKSEAVKLAKELFEKEKTTGYAGNYKYLAKQLENGDILYIFLDCTRDLASVRQFLEISLLVSLIGVAAIFFLVVLFSRRAVRPIEESYRKQKEFITNASHELKTPLAVIRSCTDVLEMNHPEEEDRKWLRGISAEITKLSALVQELVGLARMDEGSVHLEKADFDLSETVRDTLDPFSLAAESKGIAFSAQITDGLRYTGDRRLISQLVSILADNAIKYTPEDGQIDFSLERTSRHIRLTAVNTADGFAPGKQEQLFERFYRSDLSHNRKQSGYGIGLSMARAIIHAHGGKIEADSDGTHLQFTVKF